MTISDSAVRSSEQKLAHFVTHLTLESVPAASQRIVRLMAMAVIGTGFAGANEDGVAALRQLLLESGGTGQASTMVFGDKLPAHAAAQFNGTLCRALDYCDAMAPGPHFGAALFPAALAAAELAQGCTGEEFLAALVAGAETGVRCAQLAKLGVTGPQNFLAGHYGYAHLYGKGSLDPATVVSGLGSTWRLQNVVFKKYPSCGVTQGLTELALQMVNEFNFSVEEIASVEVRLPPYAHRLVGHAFQVGSNPRVDAQFSAAYCVANAFTRRSSKLAHFAPAQVTDSAIHHLIERVSVVADPAMDTRGHTAVDLNVTLRNGQLHHCELDIAPGFPGADLSDAQHLARFHDCLAYAPFPPSPAKLQSLLSALSGLEALADARQLAGLLIP